jgi:hypothetical protein
MEEQKMTETIQQLKEDIALLQMKLQKLEEIEKQPRMNLQQEGEYAVVSYHDKTYYRLENKTTFSWYIKKDVSEYHIHYRSPNLVMVNDAETERLLEGLYYNYIHVKKEKEQKWDVVRESVKWCEEHPDESVEDYLKPQTPEQVDAGLRNAMRQAKKDGVFDEPTKPMNEVLGRLENKYKDAEENAASYMTDEVVNRMLKKWEENPPEFLKFELGKTLEALITRWWCDVFTTHEDWDMETAIDDLCDRVELWLPKSQFHEGTQSVSVIDLVDGYNDALTKIKSKLRNKK